ncbi:MAG: polyprenol monophosphomannose synthase [Deltaproteobacteria bacterium]|nr:MAG: polyprenol monophosphomannose synthase [Deltaproteobacteria bacterium]
MASRRATSSSPQKPITAASPPSLQASSPPDLCHPSRPMIRAGVSGSVASPPLQRDRRSPTPTSRGSRHTPHAKKGISPMRVMVTLPTYNERENIAELIAQIRRLPGNISVVVADDDSPDRTWEIVEEIARNDEQVHLLRRIERKGRGYAGIDAFAFALEAGAEQIVEMDADFSHDPRHIPELLARLEEADLVLGSRLVAGGKDVGRSPFRKLLTRLSNAYARFVLGVPVRDCNSGFRAYRREVLERIDPSRLISEGPSIVHEILYRTHLHGFRIVEVPVVFVDRRRGSSNLNLRKLIDGYWMVLRLRWLRWRKRLP